ncbi:MAG TPA: sugar phosphate isomerase/epimerase, partial [Bacillota bacterium]
MMKLGFLSGCLNNVPLEQLVKFASQTGFTALELSAWPIVNTRDYSGSTIDVAHLTPVKADELKTLFREHNLAISSLAYYE